MPRLRSAKVEYKECPGVACALEDVVTEHLPCSNRECQAGIAVESIRKGGETIWSAVNCPECGMKQQIAAIFREAGVETAKYEGSTCLSCRKQYDPEHVRRVFDDRLIIVDGDSPTYVRSPRVRCNPCDNLVAPEEIARLSKCERCGEELWNPEQLAQILHNAHGPLSRARRLTAARLDLAMCPSCGHSIGPDACPLCTTRTGEPVRHPLSTRVSWVWVRQFVRPLDAMSPDEIDRMGFRSR